MVTSAWILCTLLAFSSSKCPLKDFPSLSMHHFKYLSIRAGICSWNAWFQQRTRSCCVRWSGCLAVGLHLWYFGEWTHSAEESETNCSHRSPRIACPSWSMSLPPWLYGKVSIPWRISSKHISLSTVSQSAMVVLFSFNWSPCNTARCSALLAIQGSKYRCFPFLFSKTLTK